MSKREIRKRAGVSQIQVAVQSGTSLPTVRLFEANEQAVSSAKRRQLEPVYAAMALVAEGKPAA